MKASAKQLLHWRRDSARVRLTPTDPNRARLQAFLALIRLAPPEGGAF